MAIESRFLPVLSDLTCDYAFYCRRAGELPYAYATAELFPSASLIKLPILLAWLWLERRGDVDRAELCDLDAEEQVQGAGLSWLLRSRRIPCQDALLLMIALSDNLCSNLIIRRAGMARLNEVFRSELGLLDTHLERRFMDHASRDRGLENWISARDCVRLFAACTALPAEDRWMVDTLLGANTDDGLLLRGIPRDTVLFHHKTGSMTGVLHDWGYTKDVEVFLLTRNVQDELGVYRALDLLGPLVFGI